MNVCQRHECQTSAGCAYRGPRGEYCYFAGQFEQPSSVYPHRIAALEQEVFAKTISIVELKARIEALEAALREIADLQYSTSAVAIARAALAEEQDK